MAKIGVIPQIPISLFRGGAEIQAIKTVESLLKQTKHEIEFVSLGGDMKKYDLIHFFGCSCTSWIRWLSRSFKIIISPIFFYNKLSTILFFKYFKYMPGSIAWDVERALHLAEFVLPNSYAEAKLLRSIFNLNPQKLIIIPNGVEADFISNDPSIFVDRFLPSYLKNKDFVLSVHRVEKRKNTLLLMESIKRTSLPLVHIGPFSLNKKDQSYIAEVRKMANQYPEKFLFLGPLPRNLLKYAYAAAKVHALLSEYETPGLASLEAGINGSNLVVLESPPVVEYFQNIAWIVNKKLENIAKALENAAARERNCFLQAEIIKEKYTWSKIAESVEKIYDMTR